MNVIDFAAVNVEVVERGLMEHFLSVASDTADIETEQLLIIRRCRFPITICVFTCLNNTLFHISALFHAVLCNES